MIQQEMKRYEEPLPSAGGTFYYSSPKIPEEAFKKALEEAKKLYRPGDKVNLAVNNLTQMLIIGFVEKADDALEYQGAICTILARNVSSAPSTTPVKYSLPELNWDSLIPIDTEETITTNGACNDDSCC